MFKKKKQPSKEPATPVLVETREHERSQPTNEVCMGKLLEGALVHIPCVLFGPFPLLTCHKTRVTNFSFLILLVDELLYFDSPKFYFGIRNFLQPGFILETNLYQSVHSSLSAIS